MKSRRFAKRMKWRFAGGLLVPSLFCALSSAATNAPPELPEKTKAVVISATPPDYPYQARRERMTGSGIVVLDINKATGLVTRAYMAKSTGHGILDDETIRTFKQWRFKPGTISNLKTPITFTLQGGRLSYEFKEKPMGDVLARYLGQGTVIKGPLPSYPSFQPWTYKSGAGVYELHAGSDGHVNDVRILKSSGDETFDKIVGKTLRKWVLARGPIIIELPLRFTLTPEKYSIDVAR